MKTPIVDFLKKYANSDISRFHMPGHKGNGLLGVETYDITEIPGADVLYGAEGIIKESEDNASSLFGSGHTFYSTQGSTLAIFAMLMSVCAYSGDEKPLIIAARNVHKAFIYAAAHVGFDVEWIYPKDFTHPCECKITAYDVKNAIENAQKKPSGIYVTSPDYLGNMLDISEISEVCKEHDIPLLVDNAHGAYLAFTEKNLHPIVCGATLCCDSAHKTLASLTGGAYLHVSKEADSFFADNMRTYLASFASTSPSYLILGSLDACNKYISDNGDKFKECEKKVLKLREYIEKRGFELCGDEPFKITINAAKSGVTGVEFAEILREKDVEAEFCDREYVVLMVSPENTDRDYLRIKDAVDSIDAAKVCVTENFDAVKPKAVMSIKKALMSRYEKIKTADAVGRVCALPTVSCPPAVSIVVSGERICKNTVELLRHYGFEEIIVVADGLEEI